MANNRRAIRGVLEVHRTRNLVGERILCFSLYGNSYSAVPNTPKCRKAVAEQLHRIADWIDKAAAKEE